MGEEKRVAASNSSFQANSPAPRGAASVTPSWRFERSAPGSSRLSAYFTMLEARDPSPYSDRPALARYGMGLFTVGAATAARLALAPVVEGQFPFLTFFFALVFAAWFGGLGPSLL